MAAEEVVVGPPEFWLTLPSDSAVLDDVAAMVRAIGEACLGRLVRFPLMICML